MTTDKFAEFAPVSDAELMEIEGGCGRCGPCRVVNTKPRLYLNKRLYCLR